jgi:hypothetical protein
MAADLTNSVASLSAENTRLSRALENSIRTMRLVKRALEEPNKAIVDTIWITELGTAVDFLDNAIQEGEKAMS